MQFGPGVLPGGHAPECFILLSNTQLVEDIGDIISR